MMIQLVRWLLGVPRRWIALAAMIVVAAMNPLFMTLQEDGLDQSTAVKYKSIDIQLTSDTSAKVAHIRQQVDAKR